MRLLTLQRSFYLLLTCLLVANYGFAQQKQQTQTEESPKQVIIIKKSKDANGNEKIEKIIREGDDLQELQFDGMDGKVIIEEIGAGDEKTIKVTVNPEDSDMKIEQHVNVDVEEINGEKHIKIRMKPSDGAEKVIEWQGEGDIPEELRKQLESDGVFLHEMSGDEKGEKNVFFYKNDDDDPDFQWKSIESSGAFLGVMSASDTKVTVIVDENGQEQKTTTSDSDVDGILVGEVVAESAAAEAGLQEGDILQAIDGKPLHNFSDLIDFMQATEVGQQVNIGYERDGQAMQTVATLQERKGGMNNMIFEKRIEKDVTNGDGDGHFFIFKSDDEDAMKIHEGHKIVVITRINKEGSEDKKMDLPAEALPETELQRSLQLRDYALFPNPSDGNLRLRFAAEAVPTVIKISDLNGKRLYRERLNRFDGQYDQNIDLSDLPAGLLLLTIEQADKIYTEQIVLK